MLHWALPCCCFQQNFSHFCLFMFLMLLLAACISQLRRAGEWLLGVFSFSTFSPNFSSKKIMISAFSVFLHIRTRQTVGQKRKWPPVCLASSIVFLPCTDIFNVFVFQTWMWILLRDKMYVIQSDISTELHAIDMIDNDCNWALRSGGSADIFLECHYTKEEWKSLNGVKFISNWRILLLHKRSRKIIYLNKTNYCNSVCEDAAFPSAISLFQWRGNIFWKWKNAMI